MTFLILPASSPVQNPCRIGYDNLLEKGTVTASNEDAKFPVKNAYDWKTYDYFRPTATGTTYINLTLAAGATANYFAFYNQDLHLHGGTIGLQYFNGTDWIDATAAIAPADNQPRMVFFPDVTATQWRVMINCASLPSIGIVSFGRYMALPFGMYLNWSPPRHARRSVLTTSLSDSGAFLGRSVISQGIATTLRLQFAADGWVDANWPSFIRHAEAKPWFFMPHVTKQPNDCALCWTDDDIPPPAHTHYGFMGADIAIRGYAE